MRVGLVLGTGRPGGKDTESPTFRARVNAAAWLFKKGKLNFSSSADTKSAADEPPAITTKRRICRKAW